MKSRSSNRVSRRNERRPKATVAAEARAKSARDHLARKRRNERRRLERERGRAESAQRRAQTRGRLTPLVFVVAVVTGFVFASTFAEFFILRQSPLKRIAVQGASALTPLAVAQGLGFEAGRTLDGIDAREIREAIDNEPWIESFRSLRLPDGTLIISVVERKAVARWLSDDSSDVLLIDRHGKSFGGRLDSGGPLPLILGESNDRDTLPVHAIQILEELRRHTNLADDPSALTLHLPDRRTNEDDPEGNDLSGERSGYVLQIGEEGPRALLGTRAFVQRVARLSTLLESEESKLDHTRWIDLRYADRAVLRTEPASG